MPVIHSTFSVDYPVDRTVIAAQDVFDQLGWSILELSSTRMVALTPGVTKLQIAKFPKMTVEFRESGSQTDLSISVSVGAGMQGSKKAILGYIGRFTNSLSLRIQTDSTSINPTVAVGQGQTDGIQESRVATNRVQQLKDLKELLDSGALTQSEFDAEKARVLGLD